MAEAFFDAGNACATSKVTSTTSQKSQYNGDVTANDLQTWKLDADTCQAIKAVVSFWKLLPFSTNVACSLISGR